MIEEVISDTQLTTLEDVLQAIAAEFTQPHGENIAAVIGYGSFFYQDHAAQLPGILTRDFFDKRPDFIVVYRDPKTFFEALGKQFGWDAETIALHVEDARDKMAFYLPTTRKYYPVQFNDRSGVARLPFRIGAISLDEFQTRTALESQDMYIKMRLRGLIKPVNINPDSEQAIDGGISNSRRRFVELAFQISSGTISGREIFANYMWASYLMEAWRFETYKADYLIGRAVGDLDFRRKLFGGAVAHIQKYVSDNEVPIRIGGSSISPQDITIDNLFNVAFDLPSLSLGQRYNQLFYFTGQNLASLRQTLTINRKYVNYTPQYEEVSSGEGREIIEPPKVSKLKYVVRKISKIFKH
ncbi:hypothetical protein JW930_02210 [Candidatus Woesearchaeota archaeon]|nr:hypothetical protein [Candidatus Woesearchaeota archaeon]